MTKANCIHLVDGRCVHPQTHRDDCVLDDLRAHQCRLVYNDSRRTPGVKPRLRIVEVARPPATPFDALLNNGQG